MLNHDCRFSLIKSNVSDSDSNCNVYDKATLPVSHAMQGANAMEEGDEEGGRGSGRARTAKNAKAG